MATLSMLMIMGFKPQRGKFTLGRGHNCGHFRSRVSNPNGVNLHDGGFGLQEWDGWGFKPQRGKFTRGRVYQKSRIYAVSNPNGVNLH